MPSFSGKFQYLDTSGAVLQEGPCEVALEKDVLTLAPTRGAAIAFDLGDIEALAPSDWDISLALYTGKRIVLTQFAQAFSNMVQALTAAYRDRLVRCLLLEDLEEIDRFTGSARISTSKSQSVPAEIRLYKSNLAVLPIAGVGYQWRFAEIDDVRFDSSSWCLTLRSGEDSLEITKLAKRTEEFQSKLEAALNALNTTGTQALYSLFPFLDPDQLQQTAALMKDGRAASVAKLRAIHPRILDELIANAVDEKLRPYFDSLQKRAVPNAMFAGFKFIWNDSDDSASADPQNSADNAGEAAADANAGADKQTSDENPLLCSFFFPFAAKNGSYANLVGWEATSRSGRATYFFRLLPPDQASALQDSSRAPATVEEAVRRLNRAIALLNFRREPIYLPDDSLELQPRFHRYVIACRKIPDLRALRGQFLGRALHSSPEAWQQQGDAIITKASA
jgi:hypothetical protein